MIPAKRTARPPHVALAGVRIRATISRWLWVAAMSRSLCAERGIYALDQINGNTLVGFSFGTVDFRQCGTDILLDGAGSDDLVFDVVRSWIDLTGPCGSE